LTASSPLSRRGPADRERRANNRDHAHPRAIKRAGRRPHGRVRTGLAELQSKLSPEGWQTVERFLKPTGAAAVAPPAASSSRRRARPRRLRNSVRAGESETKAVTVGLRRLLRQQRLAAAEAGLQIRHGGQHLRGQIASRVWPGVTPSRTESSTSRRREARKVSSAACCHAASAPARMEP